MIRSAIQSGQRTLDIGQKVRSRQGNKLRDLFASLLRPTAFIAANIHRNGSTAAQMHSRLLAERVAHEWRRATDKPLRMVGGDSDLAYGVAFYLPSRPLAFPDFNRQLAPWVDVTRLPRDGMAIVCPAADPTCALPATALKLTGTRTEVDITRSHFGVPGATGRYVITIVPPQP